jgi:hypothetical protein
MKNKTKILLVFFLLSLFIFFIGLVDDVGDIMRYSAQFSILAVTLWFSREEIINFWYRFSVIFWILSATMIVSSGGGLFGVSGGRIMAMYILSGIYFLISLIFIIYKSIKLKGK